MTFINSKDFSSNFIFPIIFFFFILAVFINITFIFNIDAFTTFSINAFNIEGIFSIIKFLNLFLVYFLSI